IRKIQIGIRIIHPPTEPTKSAAVYASAGIGLEDDSCECEDIFLEPGSIGPIGSAGAVGVRFASRMNLVFIYNQSSLNPNEVAWATGSGIYIVTWAKLSEAKTRAQHHCHQNGSAHRHLWKGISTS